MVWRVLEILIEHKLFLHPEKCEFHQKQIEYCKGTPNPRLRSDSLADLILRSNIRSYSHLVCMRDRCGKMALINHVPKHSHTLSFHSKMQINSGKIQINWNRQWAKRADCGITVVGREQSNLTYNSANYQWRKGAQRPDVQFTNWLWPYCCRKGAQRPDLQQCKLTVKEGSTATWRTIFLTVSQTVVGREQSDLIDNTICSCTDHCWKGAKRPDGQHYLLLHRPL